MNKIFSLAALTLLFSTVVFADIAIDRVPENKKTKTVDSQMIIRLDKNADEATLVISKKQAKQLRAELDQRR